MRADAANDLRRLRTEMDQHRAAHGRYPRTIALGRPASPENLPFSPVHGATVDLRQLTPHGFAATARLSSWLCVMTVQTGMPETIECAPVGNVSGPTAVPPVAPPLTRARADSPSPDAGAPAGDSSPGGQP
jgi:hypothetical protein